MRIDSVGELQEKKKKKKKSNSLLGFSCSSWLAEEDLKKTSCKAYQSFLCDNPAAGTLVDMVVQIVKSLQSYFPSSLGHIRGKTIPKTFLLLLMHPMTKGKKIKKLTRYPYTLRIFIYIYTLIYMHFLVKR